MHTLSLSFDDGFERSNLKIAQIYEKFGFSACFNVLALEQLEGETVHDEYHNYPKGNFALWNELQARGHEVMPHGLISPTTPPRLKLKPGCRRLCVPSAPAARRSTRCRTRPWSS